MSRPKLTSAAKKALAGRGTPIVQAAQTAYCMGGIEALCIFGTAHGITVLCPDCEGFGEIKNRLLTHDCSWCHGRGVLDTAAMYRRLSYV